MGRVQEMSGDERKEKKRAGVSMQSKVKREAKTKFPTKDWLCLFVKVKEHLSVWGSSFFALTSTTDVYRREGSECGAIEELEDDFATERSGMVMSMMIVDVSPVHLVEIETVLRHEHTRPRAHRISDNLCPSSTSSPLSTDFLKQTKSQKWILRFFEDLFRMKPNKCDDLNRLLGFHRILTEESTYVMQQ